MLNDFLIAVAIAWLITSMMSVILSTLVDGHKPELFGYIVALCLGPFTMVILATVVIKHKFMFRKRRKECTINIE